MPESEPPAVGPDRAALDSAREAGREAFANYFPANAPGWAVVDAVSEASARAALAASGAGLTVRDAAFQQAIDFAEQHVDDNNPDAAFMAKTIAVGLDALRLAGAGPTEPSELEIARLIVGETGMSESDAMELAAKIARLLAGSMSREQEPASDRYFTPQPVDAPPREKP